MSKSDGESSTTTRTENNISDVLETKTSNIDGFLSNFGAFTFLGYVFTLPCIVFVIIYCNIMGIPALPTVKESIFFVGRILLGTTISIFPSVFILIILFLLALGMATGFTKYIFKKENYKRNITLVIFIIVSAFVIYFNPKLANGFSHAMVSIFLIFFMLTLPVVTALMSINLYDKIKRFGLQLNETVKFAINLISAIVFLVVMLTIVTDGFIKDYLKFPQVDSRNVRLWIDKTDEYVMSCNKDIGTVLLRKSPLSNKNRTTGESFNEYQVNIVGYDYAVAICSRVFERDKKTL